MRDFSHLSCWIITDGKAGDEQPCLGVAQALNLQPVVQRVHSRIPWSWLAPFGPPDPREMGALQNLNFPDLLIASGRRAVPYLREIKRRHPQTYTVFLKDPRVALKEADLIWVPEHDRLRGANVITTLTSPHKISPDKLILARQIPDIRLTHLPTPRVAVLVGGNSRHHQFTDANIKMFCERLELVSQSASLMMTISRRTPSELVQNLKNLAVNTSSFFWDGSGDNPYLTIIALADAIIVTGDSYNMVSEALASGCAVYVFEPFGEHRKLTYFLKKIKQENNVRPFEGELYFQGQKPVDATQDIAAKIQEMLSKS